MVSNRKLRGNVNQNFVIKSSEDVLVLTRNFLRVVNTVSFFRKG